MSACVSVTVGLCFEPKPCGEKQYSHEESCERKSYSHECD
jgi:hypothetical protein